MANTPVLLTDHRFNLTPGGADDGAYTAGTPVLSDFLIDSATIKMSNELLETSEGQDEQEHNRITKKDFEIMCETTLDCGSFLRDLAVILYPGGADDYVYNAGTPLTTLKFDEVIFSQQNAISDKSARQSPWGKFRLNKKPWTVTFRKKKSATALTNAESLLVNNAIIGFNFIHAPAGEQEIEIDGHGIVEAFDTEIGGAEAFGWTLKPYGVAPAITSDDANSLISLLIANELVRMELLNDITATALDVDVTGIVSMVELAFRPDKNIIRFGIRPYGVAPSLVFA